jgi:hypothetical protein
MIIKNKMGKGHIEVIISFIVFIGFLVFLFVIFNPLNKPVNKNLTNIVFFNIGENITTNITSSSIRINDDVNIDGQGCFTIQESDLPSLVCVNPKKILAKNSSETIVASKVNNGININFGGQDKFYIIYCSEEITENENIETDCISLNRENFTIGMINTRNAWSEKKLEKFEEEYLSNYDTLKDKLIPEGNDFGFIISNLSGSVLFKGEKTIPKGVNVNANTIPVNLIDSNANIKSGTATIMIW